MKKIIAVLLFLVFGAGYAYSYNENAQPAWNLLGRYQGQPVAVQSNIAYAGAIYGLIWGNFQFINPDGHGGQLQTATFLDNQGGNNNPTEAGSSADWNGPRSTSAMIGPGSNAGNVLRTIIRPAYWIPYAGQLVSPDIFAKTVYLGYNGLPNVLHHYITVIEQGGHTNYSCVILVGYLNYSLNQWFQYDPATKSIHQVPTPPGGTMPGIVVNTTTPVIATDVTHTHAIVGYWKDNSYGYGYGWGGQYPIWAILGQPFNNTAPGFTQNYEVFTVFGSLDSVKTTLDQLYAMK